MYTFSVQPEVQYVVMSSLRQTCKIPLSWPCLSIIVSKKLVFMLKYSTHPSMWQGKRRITR